MSHLRSFVLVLLLFGLPPSVLATEHLSEALQKFAAAMATFERRADTIYRKYGMLPPLPQPPPTPGEVRIVAAAMSARPPTPEEIQAAMAGEFDALIRWFNEQLENTCISVEKVELGLPYIIKATIVPTECKPTAERSPEQSDHPFHSEVIGHSKAK